jgi:hypothetical protein
MRHMVYFATKILTSNDTNGQGEVVRLWQLQGSKEQGDDIGTGQVVSILHMYGT